jgi:enoyl-CoA hydratase/carnithine racemase
MLVLQTFNRSKQRLPREGEAALALKDCEAALAGLGDATGAERLKATGLANEAVALSKLGQNDDSIRVIARAEDIARNNKEGLQPQLLAEVMTSKGLVEAQSGRSACRDFVLYKCSRDLCRCVRP